MTLERGGEPPDPHAGEHDLGGDEPPPITLPRWIPVAIGLTLVAIAAIAVYTGLGYRQSPFNPNFTRRGAFPALPEDQGPPGEPQAGASRIPRGSSAESVPQPNHEPITTHSRISIRGDRFGLTSELHARVRRGMLLKIVPDDAMVYVNDQPIGTAHQFSTEDEVYEFPDAGNYTIRLVATGFKDALVQITADPAAKDELGVIELGLRKAK